jgi:methyltransferase-like protein/SAM-dependent methyltransferase
LAWLLAGEFDKGWPEYEFRWQGKEIQPRAFKQPRWDGANLAGRTILLYAEQGLGDTLQFIRYAILVKQRDGRVLFECPRALARLLTGSLGVDELIPEGTPLPEFDVQAPLLSLPGIFQTRLETIPALVPYFFPEVSALKHWREAFNHLKGFRVGIAWQGNPGHKYDRQRSLALRQFEPLAQIPGVRLISLQKGHGADQLDAAELPFAVLDLGRYVMDFTDTAAIIKQLDLVITCDTAIAHVAGAVNIPVWVALAFAPDWRWLREREASPWYPTMRLFRQKERGNWSEVFARIAAELRRILATGAPLHDHTRLFVAEAPRSEPKRNADLAGQLRPGSIEIHNQVAVALARQEEIQAMAERTSYDLVPYESFPYANTQPDRLATIALLLDLKPPSPRRCRVLELGCAAGGNLIPMAQNSPESTFLGIDLSRVQIAEGQETVRALGLGNVELRHLDLMEVSAELGKFDYIICHGVYSWVPERVQDRILDLVSRHLTPLGVAFISYNTYPGWHMRAMIRDMMLYHAEAYSDPLTKVKQARNLLDFLAQAVGTEKTPYGLHVKNEVEAIRGYSDTYLFHEHLEKDNRPCYFFQFAQRAGSHSLRYLGEAELRVMVPSNYPPEIANVLKVLSQDLVHLEQYMDFLRNRLFRQTLLCHANLTPNYGLRWERLRPCSFRSRARPQDSALDVASTGVSTFHGPDGAVLTTSLPLMKAALAALGDAWPAALPLPELLRQSRARLQAAGATAYESEAAAEAALGPTLLSVYASGTPRLLEVFLCPPAVVRGVSERPQTTALIRYQASRQKHVTSPFHETVYVNDLERRLLRMADGSHDRAAMVAELVRAALEGHLHVEKGGMTIQDSDGLQQEFTELVDRHLPLLAASALLVG